MGALLVVVSVGVSVYTYASAGPGETYVILGAPIAVGIFFLLRALVGQAADDGTSDAARTHRLKRLAKRGPKFRCCECGEGLADETHAMEHAEFEHGVMSYAEMKQTWERV